MPKRRPPLASLEKRIGYTFEDRKLLRRGLTHCSYANESRGKVRDNEALEFLGDAILSFVVSDELCRRYPEFREGRLSRSKASLVQTTTLANLARELNLGRHLLMGRGEEKSGGGEKESLLANTFEALVAVIYLDGGIRPTRAFIRRVLKHHLESTGDAETILDPKSALQERLQSQGAGIPYYKVVGEHGPDHSKTFEIELRVGRRILGKGKGRSKKVAQQKAARAALLQMDGDGGRVEASQGETEGAAKKPAAGRKKAAKKGGKARAPAAGKRKKPAKRKKKKAPGASTAGARKKKKKRGS